jgi:hypothetical protein
VVVADLDGVQVHLHRLRFGQELPFNAVLEGLEGNPEHARDDAYIDHVGQLLAQGVVLDLRLGQLGERHGIVGHVRADVHGRVHVFVDHDTARPHRLEVLVPGGRVEGDQDVHLVGPSHVALRRDPKLVPRREPLDVGRKDVLGGHRNAHVEDRPGQNQVCGLASGTVDRGGLNGEVVDDLLGHFASYPSRTQDFTRLQEGASIP